MCAGLCRPDFLKLSLFGGMIVTIQMWITPISYSNRSAVVIAEAIEVDGKPFESILPFEVSVTCACMNKLHCIPCLLFVLKIVHVINFHGFLYPRKIFNNEIFPDYGIIVVKFCKVAQNYSYLTSITAINNAAASQLLTIKQHCN